MALYNHVSDRRDLAHALAARVLEAVRFEDGHEDWREQIAYCFGALRAICLRHPWMPRLLYIEDVAPAAVFAPMDVSLRALAAAGVRGQDVLRAYFTLVGFTLSHASYQVRGPIPDLEPSDRIRSERLLGRGYRSIEAVSSLGDWDFDAAFEFGLMLTVRGIEAVGTQESMQQDSSSYGDR
jgi:TetR/AcrR family transcriptional regulator, tetracycline repressor protein